eukprot:CAMPEP_0114550674 /NCGR_PEP_ID=MMETSP0114-20121206/6194_1 /TAXON_ID=31324 /ORGANISM="Goniomonas sp, Strain m" /LENGTH=289 /DNA_ID=CAMNT_0001735453 /DNA_START=131 /DNA_END=1001 /DNA_ORIENTATION=+
MTPISPSSPAPCSTFENASFHAALLYKEKQVRSLQGLKLCFSLAVSLAERKAAIAALDRARQEPELERLHFAADSVAEDDDDNFSRLGFEVEDPPLHPDFNPQKVAQEVITLQIGALNDRINRLESELAMEPCWSIPHTPGVEAKEYLWTREKLDKKAQQVREAETQFHPAVQNALEALQVLELTEQRLAQTEAELSANAPDNDPTLLELRREISALDNVLEQKRFAASTLEAGMEVALKNPTNSSADLKNWKRHLTAVQCPTGQAAAEWAYPGHSHPRDETFLERIMR